MTDIQTSRNKPDESMSDQLADNKSVSYGVYLLVLAGGMFVIHGIGFMYRTYFTHGFELGVDTLDGLRATELSETHPEVASYIAHLHVSFAGLMIAVGVGIGLLAWYGVRNGQRWSLTTAVIIPVIFGLFSIPVHQTVHFDFDVLLHLGPAAVGLPILLGGAVLAHHGLRRE